MKQDDYADPDDMFSDTRMTFGEHIEDLRSHLLRAIKCFVIGMVASIFGAGWILEFITAPVDRQLEAYYQRFHVGREKKLREDFLNNRLDNLPVQIQTVKLRRVGRPVADKAAADKAVLPSLVPVLRRLVMMLDLDDPLPAQAGAEDGWDEFEMKMPDPIAFAKLVEDAHMLISPPSLKSLSIQEPLVVYFKIAIMAGFVVSSPWVFYQIWSFIAAGLYPHEKKLVNVYGPLSVVLFITGCAVCQFLVLPKAIEALFWFNELMGVQPDLRLNEWLSFAIFMPVVFGVSFQTPLVMLFTYVIGLFDIPTFREKRRMAIFLMAVFAAVITPSVDAISMMMMWVPMCLLYELGILMCVYKGRAEEETEYTAESNELVEV